MIRNKLRQHMQAGKTGRVVLPGFDFSIKESFDEYRVQSYLTEYRVEVSLGCVRVVDPLLGDNGLGNIKTDVEDSVVGHFYFDFLNSLREIRHSAYNGDCRKIIELITNLEKDILGR